MISLKKIACYKLAALIGIFVVMLSVYYGIVLNNSGCVSALAFVAMRDYEIQRDAT